MLENFVKQGNLMIWATHIGMKISPQRWITFSSLSILAQTYWDGKLNCCNTLDWSLDALGSLLNLWLNYSLFISLLKFSVSGVIWLILLLCSLQCVEALLHPLNLKNRDEAKTITDKFAAVCILQVHNPDIRVTFQVFSWFIKDDI